MDYFSAMRIDEIVVENNEKNKCRGRKHGDGGLGMHSIHPQYNQFMEELGQKIVNIL